MDESEMRARAWLAEMEACVRSIDYARCRSLFADDVVGFGTNVEVAFGLDCLERDQWRQVWGSICNFTFLTDDLHCGQRDELIWLACPWTSEGLDAKGSRIMRPGRITAVLEMRKGAWLAVHTHHSLAPRTRQ
jgi:ketosteroid isomerase-like protein